MADKGFGDFDMAKKIKASVEKIAKDKVEQLRPALRTAIVDSINTVDKYCMVTYVGETLSVKVPYNNVAPSYVGQFVRVGGPANDRRIEEVLGQTDSEDRLAQLERRCAQLEKKAFGAARMTADWDMPSGVALKVPTNVADGVTPVNIEVNPGGELTAVIPGDYRYNCTIQTSNERNTRWDLYIYKTSVNGGYTGDMFHATVEVLIGSGEYNDTVPLNAVGFVYLQEGDTLHANVATSSADSAIYVGGTRLMLELVAPDPDVDPG